MIDKKIFYCWFGGGEMSELNKKCLASWKRVCPDYEIIEINETNYDVNLTPYSAEAYEHGNWSYVSNAARLETLKHNSGFYLDTDVELAKSLDELRIFDKGFITEFETSQPDSGVLGCGSNFCDLYDEVYNNLKPGTVLHKEFIKALYRKYDIHGESIKKYDDGFVILGEEWFPSTRTHLFTTKTIGIHYFENTWMDQWREITDPFVPFPKMVAFLGHKLIHQDKDPIVRMQIKNLHVPFNSDYIISKTAYFNNPKVIKVITPDFEAERICYNTLAPTNVTVTPTGSIVTWLDI